MEANKRILGQLPVAAQSFTSSPYLDKSLYSYDEKWVSPMERPKAVGEFPIRQVIILKLFLFLIINTFQ